jgi:hypothetical protein
MYTHLEAELAKVRIQEARDWATRQAVLKSLRTRRAPVRVVIGLSLVRVGRWLAGSAKRPRTAPRRAIA